jgi:hypothetical protein
VIVESVDSRDQIRGGCRRLYGRSPRGPDFVPRLPIHYCTSTKSPVALTAGVVEVPAKEKRQ